MSQIQTDNPQMKIFLHPTIGDSLANAWHTMKHYFLELLLILIISFLFSLPMWFFDNSFGNVISIDPLWSVILTIYGLLILTVIDYGTSYAFLRAARGEKVEAKHIFEGFQNYWNVVLANILVFVIIAVGCFLLLIPGIIFACRLAFVRYLVVDKKLDVIESVKMSWRMTRGFSWRIFGLAVVSIFIGIGGLILFLVGLIPAMIWIDLSFAFMYYSVSRLWEQPLE